MTDLVSRLRAAITTRLELARAVARSETANWSHGDEHFGEAVMGDRNNYAVVSSGYGVSWELRQFIAANDPAFVIRACERDLRVLDRHALVCDAGDDECKTCLTDLGVFGDQAVPVAWPCPEIRDLASVYSVEVEA